MPFKFIERNGLRTKVPTSAVTGRSADATDPANWCTFEDARRAVDAGIADGVGFVLGDGFFGIDLDRCFLADNSLHPIPAGIIARVSTYWEKSQSGRGAKCIGRGNKDLGTTTSKGVARPKTGRKKSMAWEPDGALEVYTGRRFFALTSGWIDGPLDVREQQAALDGIFAEWFPSRKALPSLTMGRGLDGDDDTIITRATAASNGNKFARLWSGDATGYGSASEADLALCGLLAFWTGPDPDRIDRLFRASALCREKWLERGDYRQATITRALDGKTFYNPCSMSIGARVGLAAAMRDGNWGYNAAAGVVEGGAV